MAEILASSDNASKEGIMLVRILSGIKSRVSRSHK
jgi:hypothetical protein